MRGISYNLTHHVDLMSSARAGFQKELKGERAESWGLQSQEFKPRNSKPGIPNQEFKPGIQNQRELQFHYGGIWPEDAQDVLHI